MGGGGTFWIKLRIALGAGLLAFMAARAGWLPVWRAFPIGDATDFGGLTAWTVWWLLTFLERK